jgi:formate dehydrogenase (coenzyme F420) beta subunit
MDTHWMIETHGDPLLSVHGLLSVIWEGYGLGKMMVPADGSQSINARPVIYDKINQLDQVNPFRPIMASNTARFIPEFIHRNQAIKLAVILRPCELRSFIEMTKHKSITTDNLITICIDCLGTYPIDEFQWRSQRKGSVEGLTLEAIKNARQGSLVPYRSRPACQMCTAPEANNADINLEIIGIPVRKFIFVKTKNRGGKSVLEKKNVFSGEASSENIEVRDKMLAKITERNGRVKDRVMRGLSDVLPANLDDLISHLSDCGSCQKCILNCPICSVDMPKQTKEGKYLKEDLMNWLVSCSGCGMCEQSCPQDQPLVTIFGFIRDQLIDPLNYTPGRSFEESLPVL